MASNLTKKFVLYRFRYLIGYSAFGLIFLLLIGFQFFGLPNGLTPAEISSATAAGAINWADLQASDVVNLPYHAVQGLAIKTFGLSELAIRLPSLIFACLTAVAMIFMLRRFSRPNIAIVAGFVALSSVFFLSLAHSGSPAIMAVFWMFLMLLAAVETIYGDKKHALVWQLILALAAAGSLYAPFGIYPLLALAAAGLAHPKTRLILLKQAPWKLASGGMIGLLLLAPLIWAVIKDFAVAGTLLGFGEAWSPGAALANVGQMLFGTGTGAVDGWITPVISLVGMIIIITGLLRVCTDIFAARSYLIVPWLVVVLGVVIYNQAALPLLYPPFILLLAIGLETIVREWYKLFPNNPYARTTALVPLSVLVISLAFTTTSRFFMAQTYYAPLVQQYNQELGSARAAIQERFGKNISLIVPSAQLDFYKNLENEFANVKVSDKASGDKTDALLVLNSAKYRSTAAPRHLIASDRAENGLLLRIYEP
jgi:4-amino-4-deoxy-L-arabinose transferase-like glycosyltransferase